MEQELQAAHGDLEGLIAARTAALTQENAQLRQDISDCRQGRAQ